MKPWSIWIGYDPREVDAFVVAKHSIMRRLYPRCDVNGLILSDLQGAGLYTRPTWRDEEGRLIDGLSVREDYNGAMSTEFAISRFLTPYLATGGYALFVDADVMARTNVASLFEWAAEQPQKALWCVQHDHVPVGTTKMDGQSQSAYGRKNWTSVMLWNCDSPAVKALTPEVVNTWTGKDLHQLKFLKDDEIGALDPTWNHLVGEYPVNPAAKLAHFTLGVPSFKGYEDCEFADAWREELALWVR